MRPVSSLVFFHACGTPRGMKAQVPAPPTVTSSPILKVISPVNTQATSSLSRCRWKFVSAPKGAVSSNSMMLPEVSPLTSFSAAERPRAMSNTGPPPGGTIKPFPLITFSSHLHVGGRFLGPLTRRVVRRIDAKLLHMYPSGNVRHSCFGHRRSVGISQFPLWATAPEPIDWHE